MTVESWCWGGGGFLPPPPANYQAGSYNFIITSPTLAGERMLLIPKISILSEQIKDKQTPHTVLQKLSPKAWPVPLKSRHGQPAAPGRMWPAPCCVALEEILGY